MGAQCPLQSPCAGTAAAPALCSAVVSPTAGSVLPRGSSSARSCGSAAEELCNFICDCGNCFDENQCGGCPPSPCRAPGDGARALWVQDRGVDAGPWCGCRSMGWVQDPEMAPALP